MRAGARLSAALAAAALLGVACAGGTDEGADALGGAEDRAQVGRAAPELEGRAGAQFEVSDAGGAAHGEPASAAALPRLAPMVIKTAEVEIEIARGRFETSMQRSIEIAERYGGFVESTSTEGERSQSGTLAMRVPAESFERALGDLKALGTVTHESVSGEDVTQEFVDLEARLRNLTAQEKVLLRLMDRARTVVATIRVQRELHAVQLEIERIRGRMTYLEDRTSFSTIAASFIEEGAVEASGRAGTLARAWDQAIDGFFGLVGAVIVASGVVVPLLVVVAVGFLLFRRLRPRATG